MSRPPTDPSVLAAGSRDEERDPAARTGTGLRLDRIGPAGAAAGGLAGLMLLALVPGVPAPVRAVVAVGFFVAAPGLAWIRALPVDGPVERAAVVVALSLAIDVVVAQGLLYAGVTGVGPVLAALGAVVAAGLAVTTPRRPEGTA